MSEFTPADGAAFFAWRNTFHRVNERTYDWLYRREDITDSTGYIFQEIPYQDGLEPVEWVRLIHERTFGNAQRVERYVKAILRRLSKERNATMPPLAVKENSAGTEGSDRMRYSDGVLYVPPPSPQDIHEDPTGDPINRERFISGRWKDGQRLWPIAEHHVLHEIAHHVTGSNAHGEDFLDAFGDLLRLASENSNFSIDIWNWEILLATRLHKAGLGAVDMTTGVAYDASGAEYVDSAALVA